MSNDAGGFLPVPEGFLMPRHREAPKVPGADVDLGAVAEALRRAGACGHAAPADCSCPGVRWCRLHLRDVDSKACKLCKLAEIEAEAAPG